MFEYLQQIDEKVYERYLTTEKNIKAASNSFYNSFLDLQEHFLRVITAKNNVACDEHESCGAILRRDDVKNLFLDKYNLDSYTYDKMCDYAKKANEHKHRKEKNIQCDTVVSYMYIFYDVSSCCAEKEGIIVAPFDRDYFKLLFGKMHQVSERLEGIEEGQ